MSLELIYNCERERIQRKQDAVVCAIHSSLLSAGLKCIGIGEELLNADSAKPSDMLPTGWNGSADVYLLNYRSETSKQTFLLKTLVVDESLYVHLMRRSDEKTSELEINSTNQVTDNFSEFCTAYKDLDRLLAQIRTELVNPILAPATTSTSSGTQAPSQGHRDYDPEDPLRVGPPPNRHPCAAGVGGVPLHDPLRIGARDLDPLGVGGGMGLGGGMIFDPLRSGGARAGPQPPYGPPGGPGIPRGSVPPGARFDPFGPPDLDPRGRGYGGYGFRGDPDPDHLPPPGYDNMFM